MERRGGGVEIVVFTPVASFFFCTMELKSKSSQTVTLRDSAAFVPWSGGAMPAPVT